MAGLKFSVVLKEISVILTGKDSVEKNYTLRELTGAQRAEYNESFDVKIEMKDGEVKAVAGEGFKMMPANQFLSMCLYDESNILVSEEVIGSYPSTVVNELHTAALKLSGLDKEALETAKNESGGSDSSGKE